MNSIPLLIATTRQGHVAVIGLRGRFDHRARGIFSKAVCGELADSSVDEIRIDFSELGHIDSCAMGALLVAKEDARRAAKIVSISGAAGRVEEVLRTALFDRLFRFR